MNEAVLQSDSTKHVRNSPNGKPEMTSTMKHSPRKFQETASAMLRQVAPLLTRARSMSFKKLLVMPREEVDRSNQQTELLKWQQDMFHKILNTMCLVQDGLLDTSELVDVRDQIIRTLVSVHPEGEWADFTRDKLLFLQDLHQTRCISDEDYHAAKLPLLERLAEQGAHIGTQDFKLHPDELKTVPASPRPAVTHSSSISPQAPQQHEVVEPQAGSANAGSAPPTPNSGSTKKKTPIKHVMDAVSRITSSATKRNLFFEDKQQADEEREKQQQRVPHALDFVRTTPGCPTREPPVTPVQQLIKGEGHFESPLFKHSNSTGGGFARQANTGLPSFRSDTTDLLPQLSKISLDNDETPTPSSPSTATQPKPTLTRAKSLTPSKLSFTPRSTVTVTPAKSPLGLSNSSSRNHSMSASPGGKLEKSVTRKFSGILRGWQKTELVVDTAVDEEMDLESPDIKYKEAGDQDPTPKKTMWQRLDVRGGTGWSSGTRATEEEDDFGREVSDRDPLIAAIKDYPPEKMSPAYVNGEGPNIKKLKKKVSVRAAPTNFFIDQVLGDNIKSELERIRQVMAKSNPGSQTFTNEQIDAIATRLPVDKGELMRFFPKAWCDRYGDVVLEVVHKQFKSHVTEMDGLRTASKEKQRSVRTHGAAAAAGAAENDENRRSTESGGSQTATAHHHHQQSGLGGPNTDAATTAAAGAGGATQNPKLKKAPRVKHTKSSGKTQTTTTTRVVYTTEGSLLKEASVYDRMQQQAKSPPSDGRARRAVGYEDLDGKLGAEILRMPFRNFNESTRY